MPELAHTADELPPPTVEEVSPGIYAYIQLDGTWGLNNTGFLTGGDAVSVIDTCFTEARTRTFLQAIRGVTGLPLRTLVNTHHHGDHTHGNYLVPGASIVGHELCRQTVIDTGIHTLRPLFPNVVWGDLELAPPFITFQDRLDLFVDDLKLELHYMGPAHTTNDVIVWLPERRLMFTGDLAFNGGTPFVAMGSIAGSLVALDRLREFGAETVIPGHGPVCGPGGVRRHGNIPAFRAGQSRGRLRRGSRTPGRGAADRPRAVQQVARLRAPGRQPAPSLLGAARRAAGHGTGPGTHCRRHGCLQRRATRPVSRLIDANESRFYDTCPLPSLVAGL